MSEPIEETNVPDIEELQAKCDEYLNGWKRAQADYANLKKETESEKSEFAKYANEQLLSELLPAFDHLYAAIASAPDLPEHTNWLKGLKATLMALESSLKSIGLEKVDTNGSFDPTEHDAVDTSDEDGVEAGKILTTHQTGWKLHGKLIRPAKVVVAK